MAKTTITNARPSGLMARLASALSSAVPRPAGAPDQTPKPGGTVNRRHQDALAVLTAARAVVRRGWAQHAWYVTASPAGRRSARQRFFPTRLDHTQVVEACLIGAVIHAAWEQSPRPEHAYPAIDALWHALFEADPQAHPDPVGPCSPPLVRSARVRDLTTWNDRDHRTKEDVLALLDRAASRVASAPLRPTHP